MKIEVNPFGIRKPVSEFSSFIGRRKVVHDILASLLHGTSVSIVGMPKIGSTSLLRCLLLPEMAAEYDVSFDSYLPVYVNLHALPTSSTEHLFDSILQALEKKTEYTKLPARDAPTDRLIVPSLATEYPGLIERFQGLRKTGLTPIVLLDELDYAVTNPNMDLSLFKLMLFLQECSLAIFVTSSHRSLIDVEERIRLRDGLDDDLGSRDVSHNEFLLLPFTHAEATAFLTRLPGQMRSDQKLNSMLLAISGGHPYLLQLASFHAVEQYRQKGHNDLRLLWQDFYRGAEAFFQFLWSTMTKEAKRSIIEMEEERLKTFGLPNQSEREGFYAYYYFRKTGGGILLEPKPESSIFSYAFGQYVLKKRAASRARSHDRYVLSQLRSILAEHFNLEELQTLCHDLGISYENIGGETKEGKIRELVAAAMRRGFLSELIEVGVERRPNVEWP